MFSCCNVTFNQYFPKILLNFHFFFHLLLYDRNHLQLVFGVGTLLVFFNVFLMCFQSILETILD